LLWLAFRVDFVRDVALVAMVFAGLALMGMALLFWGKSWAWLSRQKFLATWKVKFGCAEIETSLMQLRKAKGTLLFFTVISFLEQFLPVTVVYFIAKAVQIPLSLAGCVAFVPISIFLQRLPLSFMGLGVREGSYVLFLYFLGIDAGMAVGLGMLVFAIETLSLLPAAIWLLIDWFMTGEMPA
jgi:uncharacterized membrane protein YbhN (UPF0104 family)